MICLIWANRSFVDLHPPIRSSNFKRQNTIDPATIKDNTARIAAQRPASAQPKPVSATDSTLYPTTRNRQTLTICRFFVVVLCSKRQSGEAAHHIGHQVRSDQRQPDGGAERRDAAPIHHTLRKDFIHRKDQRFTTRI